MNLRLQMLLAGAMTLVVPIIGWQSIRQLNESLIQSRVDAQRLTIANLQLSVAEASSDTHLQSALQLGAVARSSRELDAAESPGPFVIDGYGDDWFAVSGNATHYGSTADSAITVRTAVRRGKLYLLIDVADDSLVWHRPPRVIVDAGENESPDPDRFVSNGDAVEVLILRNGEIDRHVLLRAVAPGLVQARTASVSLEPDGSRIRRGARMTDVDAAWQQRRGGYRVETALPDSLSLDEIRIGVVAIDIDRGSHGTDVSSFGVTRPVNRRGELHPSVNIQDVPILYRPSAAASALLGKRVVAGNRARLFDSAGRRLANIDRLNERREDAVGEPLFSSLWDALLFRLYSWLVAGDLPLPESNVVSDGPLHLDLSNELVDGETRRYVTPARDRVLGTILPVGQIIADDGSSRPSAWLWYESNEEHSSAYTGSHLARLFSLLILASLVAGSVLFAWGAWLSLRIRRLSRAASFAVTEDGRPGDQPMLASRAHDELGTLSRDLASLLGRSADYNRYLETLSKYLSHELRTPLSVVRTSLENLEDTNLGDDSRALLMRAAGGADELGRIITAIVESTRLEQTIEDAEKVSLDIEQFVDDCIERYRQVYPRWRIAKRSSPSLLTVPDKVIFAAPDLLVQALDKLVDNAVEHATEAELDIVLDRVEGSRQSHWLLAVANPGDFWSKTQDSPQNESRHMGLGLHMVRMIAESHAGQLVIRQASNGPVVGLTLPASQ